MISTEVERIVAHVRKVAANEGGIRCGICAKDVQGLASVCTSCEAPYHTDCWDYNSGCAVYGCKAAPRDPVQLDMATLKMPPPRRGVFGARAVVALLALLGLGAWVTQSSVIVCRLPASVPASLASPAPSAASAAPAAGARRPGGMTLRIGGAANAQPGMPAPLETMIEARIVVCDAAVARRFKLHSDGHELQRPLLLPISGEELESIVARAEAAGSARSVANPRLLSTAGSETIVRIGKRMMFTGRPEAEREPGCLQVRFKPVDIGAAGLGLEVAAGDGPRTTIAMPYGHPMIAMSVTAASGEAPALFERWRLGARAAEEAVVFFTAHSKLPAEAPANPFATK